MAKKLRRFQGASLVIFGVFFLSLAARAKENTPVSYDGYSGSGFIEINHDDWPNEFYRLKNATTQAADLLNQCYVVHFKGGQQSKDSHLLSIQKELMEAGQRVAFRIANNTSAELLQAKSKTHRIDFDSRHVPIWNVRTNEVWPEVTVDNARRLSEEAHVLNRRLSLRLSRPLLVSDLE